MVKVLGYLLSVTEEKVGVEKQERWGWKGQDKSMVKALGYLLSVTEKKVGEEKQERWGWKGQDKWYGQGIRLFTVSN